MASAVVVPKPDGPNVERPRMKRRQSSVSEGASKRPRISTEDSAISPSILDSSPQVIDSSKNDSLGKTEPLGILSGKSRNADPERRRSSVQEERKRGQRLFGGLLNTLNQSTPNGQQRKRQEVEARQKERAAQRKAEAEDRKREQVANLKAVRLAEQMNFQEESVSYIGETRETKLIVRGDANSAYEYASYGPISFYRNRAKTCKDQASLSDDNY